MGVDNGEGTWGNGANEEVVVVGCCVHKHEAGDRVWAKKVKPSRCSWISGAPCETVKGDDAEGWCGVYKVAVVMGLCAHKMRGREGVWAKIRNQAVLARFRAMWNGDRGWCIRMVW
jgi:hypothetical protein